MEQRFLSIEEFNTLLNEWSGHPVKISKHELDDIDETLLELNTISYAKDTRRIDDYEPTHALHLNGTGQIQNEDDNTHPLPEALYEIPLEDTTLYEFDGTRFLLSTDRGVYKIELAHPAE